MSLSSGQGIDGKTATNGHINEFTQDATVVTMSWLLSTYNICNMECGIPANHVGTTNTSQTFLDSTAAMVVLYLLVSLLVLWCHSDPTHRVV